MDYSNGVAYRAIVEPLASNALSVRYLFGKQINISSAGAITTLDDQPIDPALTTSEWTDIYAAVGRQGFYGQFIAEVVGVWSAVERLNCNQLKGITMETVGGNGFNNVCFKQNLVDAPVLWGQNMLSQECLIGQNKSVVFTLYDNFGCKIPTQYLDTYNNQLLEIQFQ
ncbi:MAG: hypothetical protein EZS28_013469 [Streblomastix strix]|uniref:Uncharacterized protein n=1 Tax=Streblomastix strix TaxID=222440 RepID=A0A5J4W813_9EUKA|nr:MAG: hypothetical protein EZS28_013469 [Streblomastix strix]